MRSKALLASIVMAATCAAIGLFGSASALAQPFHWMVPHRFSQPPTTADCEGAFDIACYSPNQFEQAYNMNPLYRAGLTGAGRTIVLVDSFGSPTIADDLKTFR